MVKICIDAGHYGKYNRSPAINSYYESDMTWKLTNLQKKFFEEYEDVKVVLTRSVQSKDKDLYERGVCSKGCSLFISNHSNAVGNAVNESIDYVAAYHLVNDTTTSIDDISKRIANVVAPVISKVMGTKQGHRVVTRKADNDRNRDGLMNDNYYGVLHGARMAGTPGLLLEHGFHTNTQTTKWLLDDDNLAKLAKTEVEAIAKYFKLSKKDSVPVAPKPPVVSKKTTDQIAREVINGKWGNGQDRKTRLTKAGYNYAEIQKRVNELL